VLLPPSPREYWMRRGIAERLIVRLAEDASTLLGSTEGFRHFVASMPAPVASGWSESPGGPCTHWKAPPCHGARRKRPIGCGKIS
jgi:hypothetical protein